MDNKLPSIKERILYLAENVEVNKQEFFRKIDITYGNFTGDKKKRPVNSDAIENILLNYPQTNAEWLLTGNGKMIKETGKSVPDETEERKRIPLIPIEAMAGYGKGDSPVMQYDLNSGYNIPELEGKGVEYLIRVSGSSMYPKYSNGDLLACKPLKDLSFFQWGKPYVLDTEQGAIVKRLFQCDDNNEYLECVSDNKTHYPSFKIPKTSVRAVAIVVGVIRLE
jgi:repressor LexA